MTDRPGSEPQSVREAISLLESHFFDGSDPGGELRRADAFLENAIRLIVFDTQLAIDELLRSHVFDGLERYSELSLERRVNYVKELTSRQVLDLALQLGIVGLARYRKLRELNALRNNAAHHWDLDEPIRRRSGQTPQEHPLTWESRRLTPELTRTRFAHVYGDIYRELFDAWKRAHPDGARRGGAGEAAGAGGTPGAPAPPGGNDGLHERAGDGADTARGGHSTETGG